MSDMLDALGSGVTIGGMHFSSTLLVVAAILLVLILAFALLRMTKAIIVSVATAFVIAGLAAHGWWWNR